MTRVENVSKRACAGVPPGHSLLCKTSNMRANASKTKAGWFRSLSLADFTSVVIAYRRAGRPRHSLPALRPDAFRAAAFLPVLFLLIAGTPIRAAQPNVLLISVDTLRADHLSCYGGKIPTPAFDSLAARSVLFEQAISQVPLTLPSHTTLLTGLFPDQHGVRNNENFALSSDALTVAEVFRSHGYATGAVVGSFSLDSSFGLSQGFQDYEDHIGTGDDPSANRYLERRAATIWKLGRAWIDKQKQPWFCFLHFFDPHTGYNPPSPYPQTYDGEVAYVDSILKEMLAYLNTSRLFTNTVVVLVSDHGEALGEHGETSHGVFLYDATLHVPLMIAAPGWTPARVAAQVRLVDVAPTLLEMAGINDAAFHPAGQSLTEVLHGAATDRPAYSESYYTNLLMGWAPLKSVRWNRKKYIQSPQAEFYNLQNDPGEIKNTYTPSAIPLTMQREIGKHAGKPLYKPDLENADPDVKEKLMSLGYVTGGSATSTGSGFDPKDGIGLWTKMEAGVTAAQQGSTGDSIRLFQEVLKQQPDNVIARKFLANVLRKTGDLSGAAMNLREALKSNLHRNETRYDLAEVLYEQGQFSQSLDLLLQVVGEEKNNRRALKLAAAAAMKSEKYDIASTFLAQAVQIDPADDEAISERARVLSYLQRDSEAIDLYQQLAQLRSLKEDECIQAAALYLTRQDIEHAEKYFRDALKLNPDSTRAWKGIALIQASRQKWSEALEAFLKSGDCPGARGIIDSGKSVSPEALAAMKKQCP